MWKPEIHTNCSSLSVVFNYQSIPGACPFCCGVNLPSANPPSNSRKFRIPMLTCLPSQFSYWLFLYTYCDHWSTTASLMLPHTFQMSDWKLVEDITCMRLCFKQWLDTRVWPDSIENWTCGRCSGVGQWTVSAKACVTYSAEHKRSDIIEWINK